jgi:hypothetical protein
MLVTQQPVLRRFWYPVMPLDHLAERSPILHPAGSVPRPLAHRQRHPLPPWRINVATVLPSFPGGIVKNGCVRCPYHGWSFDAQGTCVNVPQLDPGATLPKPTGCPPSTASSATAMSGSAWQMISLQPIPDIPQYADTNFRYIHEFYEPWKVSGLRAIENSFDSAHGHFVHASSWGDEANPKPPPD